MLLLAGLYLLSGHLISVVVKRIASSEGIELLELQISRPGISHWVIPHIKGRSDQLLWSFSNAQLTYNWRGLLNNQLQSVVIDSLNVEFISATAVPKSKNSSNSPLSELGEHLAPEYWLQRLPWQMLTVNTITLDLPSSQTKLKGDLKQNKNDVRFNSHIINADLNLEHDLVLAYTPAKGLAIDLSRAELSKEPSSPLLSVSSQFKTASLDLSLQANLADEDAQEFASILGRPDVTLKLLSSATTTLPWPLPEDFSWEQLSATGSYRLSIFTPRPVPTEPQDSEALRDLQLSNLSGDFTLRAKSLELQLIDGLFSIAQEGTSSKASCSVNAEVTATVTETRWAMSDGISCVVDGTEKLKLSLLELSYRNEQDAEAVAPQEEYRNFNRDVRPAFGWVRLVSGFIWGRSIRFL